MLGQQSRECRENDPRNIGEIILEMLGEKSWKCWRKILEVLGKESWKNWTKILEMLGK